MQPALLLEEGGWPHPQEKMAMGIVDARMPCTFDDAIRVNLEISKNPRAFAEFCPGRTDVPEYPENNRLEEAAHLGRQASATVVILCAAKFELAVNWCISALDPTLFGASEIILRDLWPKTMNLAEIVYRICNRTFDKAKDEYASMILIAKLRNAIVHDKPLEGAQDNWVQEAENWRQRLKPRVENLDWLPEVRCVHKGDPFTIGNEAPVHKVMIYPVASWAASATDLVTKEMVQMVLDSGLRLREMDGQIGVRSAPPEWWAAGI